MIVGVDPGKTSAIACITLSGKLIRAAHRTFGGSSWIIREIRETGIPSVIATDKSRPGEVIRRVNAAFSSRLFLPDRDLGSDEKRVMAKSAGITNRHEQDAYASAIKAFNKYANKLNQAGRSIGAMPIHEQDSIKARIIGRHSISEAIQDKKANRR